MSGAEAARPWHEAAKATFLTAVDPDNVLGRLFDYKSIPNAFFLDETGTLVGKWLGFSVDQPECLEAVDRFRAGSLEPFERAPQKPFGTTGSVSGTPVLSDLERELYEKRVRLGAELLAAGKKEQAIAEWRKALSMDPENFVLRKQIWMLLYPEKFFPEIDYDWQKEHLARERAQEAETCGPEGCLLK